MFRHIPMKWCVLVFFLTLSGAAQKDVGPRYAVGVAPVFDASGDPWGEDMAAHVTLMMFDELRSQSVFPVMISPGGVYNPLDEDWIREYGKEAGVDVVLVTTLQRSDRPRSGDWTLKMESFLLEVNGSGRSTPTVYTQSTNRRNLYQEFGAVGMGGIPSRAFEKQPIGKIARHFAEGAAKYAQGNVNGVSRAGTAPTLPASGSCEVAIRVKYPNKSESQAYQLVVNDREESLWVKQGVARVQTKSGVLVMQVKTQDAPYKLPVQSVYQMSTVMDCARPEKNLTLSIGPAGEGLLAWQ